MPDSFLMDGHKLAYHPLAVGRRLAGEEIFPLYVEVSPSGGCNHRCVFCALDFLGYAARFLPAALYAERVAEMGRLGVKSVMFAGEGEPLLHRDIAGMARATREAGVDAALTTNGVLLAEPLAGELLPALSWLRVSFNAGTPATYARVHRADPGDFAKVLKNVERAASLARINGWPCTLGLQTVLLPDNAGEVETLARLARDAGAAYLAVKPYSQHLKSATRTYEGVDYSPFAELEERLKGFETPAFRVIFRSKAFAKHADCERPYRRCLALPFWAYVDSGAILWGCSAHLGDDRFNLGSLAQSSFKALWRGEKRKLLTGYAADSLDPADCRLNCRMDEVNRYLWEISHPPAHVNFI